MKKTLFIFSLISLGLFISSCKKDIEGCMDSSAINYNSEANINNNSCLFDSDGDGVYDEDEIFGCTNDEACNFNIEATEDDSSCEYPVEGYDCDDVFGCTDNLACNYNPAATIDNNSCEYPVLNYDCNDVCIDEQACNYGLTELCQYSELGYDCEGNFTEYVVGMEAEGGIVFYLDETGQNGLVAASEDIGNYQWGCQGQMIYGADSLSIGTGLQNTLYIVSGCSDSPIAASEALAYESEGYNDWYLPSFDELNEIYNTIGNGGTYGNIGEFESNRYWSSSDSYIYGAWSIDFYDGTSDNAYLKSNPFSVRPIRSF